MLGLSFKSKSSLYYDILLSFLIFGAGIILGYKLSLCTVTKANHNAKASYFRAGNMVNIPMTDQEKQLHADILNRHVVFINTLPENEKKALENIQHKIMSMSSKDGYIKVDYKNMFGYKERKILSKVKKHNMAILKSFKKDDRRLLNSLKKKLTQKQRIELWNGVM